MHYTLYILILCAINLTQQRSAPIGMAENNKYFLSGSYNVHTWESLVMQKQYQVPFKLILEQSEVEGVHLSINYNLGYNMLTNITYLSFYFNVNLVTKSSFFFSLYNNKTLNQSLSVRYLVFSTKYADNYNWKLININQAVNLNNDTQCTYFTYNVPTDFVFNTQGQINYALSILGFDVFLNYTGIQLELTLVDISRSLKNKYIILRVYYCGNDTPSDMSRFQNLQIFSVKANVIIYNRNYFQKQQYACFYTGYVKNYPFYNQSNLYDNATLFGVNYIKSGWYNNYTCFNSGIYIPSNGSNQIRSYQDRMCYNSKVALSVTYLFIYDCGYLLPYFRSYDKKCYDYCPKGTITNHLYLECEELYSIQEKTLGIITLVILIILLVLLIIIALCYRKVFRFIYLKIGVLAEQREEIQIKPQSLPNHQQQQLNNLDRSQVALPRQSQIGVWRDREIELFTKQECCICLLNSPFFKTECQHLFHITCIIAWTHKNDNCPYCRKEGLSEKNHRVFCRHCKLKQRWIKFSDLKQSEQVKTLERELCCPVCEIIPV